MRREGAITVVVAIVMFIMVVAAIIMGVIYATERSELTECAVTGKEAVRSNDSNEYRVYTDNCGTLKVGDSIFIGRFDSADVYSRIKENQTYDMKLQGFRLPVFSMFPNIIEATPV